MGYTLELGYAEKTVVHKPGFGGYTEVIGFKPTRVQPFTGSSIISTTPPTEDINTLLNIVPYEYGDDPLEEPTEFPVARAVDDEGLVDAEIDVTNNYSERIMSVTGIHLAWLHGHGASEAAAPLMQLIAGLGDEGFGDYWSPTDGNIKHLPNTLLGWVFQHPDAVFYTVG